MSWDIMGRRGERKIQVMLSKMPSSVSAYEMNLLIQNRKSFSSIQNLDLQTQFFRPKRAKLQHSVILSGQMTHQQLTPY